MIKLKRHGLRFLGVFVHVVLSGTSLILIATQQGYLWRFGLFVLVLSAICLAKILLEARPNQNRHPIVKIPMSAHDLYSMLPKDVLSDQPMLFLSTYAPLGSLTWWIAFFDTNEGAFVDYYLFSPLTHENLVHYKRKIAREELENVVSQATEILDLNRPLDNHQEFHTTDPCEFRLFVGDSTEYQFITASGYQASAEVSSLVGDFGQLFNKYEDEAGGIVNFS